MAVWGSEKIADRPQLLLAIAVATCLALQLWMIVALEINWDEFFYLSHLYDFQRGEMVKALQSLHVHLLGWVTSLPGNEMDQVTAGRFVMLAFLTATCGLIYALAREFFSPATSATAVLAFATAGPTIIHGASFRADPISATFIMLSLVVLARGKATIGTMLLAGAAAAIAAMITIKVALYAPAFLGIAAWRLQSGERRKATVQWLVGTAATAAAVFAALYLLQLTLIEQSSNSASQSLLGNAARTTLVEAGLLPRLHYILRAAFASPVQSVLTLAGGLGVTMAFFRSSGAERARQFAIGCCGAMLLCLLFYRNAFPYFYPFIFPPAMLLVAWVIDWSSLLRRPIPLALIGTVLLGPAIYVAAIWSARDVPPQRTVVEAVHWIFPQPVVAIDKNHMIGSFPKRGFFMSTWGIANYRGGKPLFADILRRDTVPLLLVNSVELADAVNAPGSSPVHPARRLFEDDRAVLRENYIPHWGPIWVAGKQLEPGQSEFNILVPGLYTLEGDVLEIDGRRVMPGATVHLARGIHQISSEGRASRVLRWGNHLRRPKQPPPAGPLFVGF